MMCSVNPLKPTIYYLASVSLFLLSRMSRKIIEKVLLLVAAGVQWQNRLPLGTDDD